MANEMTSEVMARRAGALRDLEASQGWAIVCELVDGRISEAWESFIAMPVDKKTNKAALATQARYMALKELKGLPAAEARVLENRIAFKGRK